MKVGFHYHSNFKQINGKTFVPGYIGVFIDGLAGELKELHLFLSEALTLDSAEEDYEIKRRNIIVHSLGPARSFPKRILSPQPSLKLVKDELGKVDLKYSSFENWNLPSKLFGNSRIYLDLTGKGVIFSRDLRCLQYHKMISAE